MGLLKPNSKQSDEFFHSGEIYGVTAVRVDTLAQKSNEFTCTDQSEANYLEVSSTCSSEKEEEGEEEERQEEEGSISDWSEEDLSLHFSPSVILPSDDEDSDPESSYECVDITMETQMKGHEGEGIKMVPKRQIQLKKKKDTDNFIDQKKTEKEQVIPKDEPEEGGARRKVSANELLSSTIHHRPEQLLRQHSMPASLHTHPITSSIVNGYRVYKGLIAGASQGFHVEGNSRQRLQKSISLDESKTKMASCIIKSVLSKKMQVEQKNSETSNLQKTPVVLPSLRQPADKQMLRDGGGGKTSGGVFKAPVHVVRDIRSLVKNTCSLSFSTAPTTAPENNNKQKSVTDQEESPPPTYQQAVVVKGHDETKRNFPASGYGSSCSRHVTKVAAFLSQLQDSNQSERFSHPITQQRRGSEPVISKSKEGDVNAGTSLPPSVFIQTHPRPPSTCLQSQGTQPRLFAPEQTSNLGVSLQSAPGFCQQILHPCFNNATALPGFPPTLQPHLGKVSYVHSPLTYFQTQLQPPQPAPTLHVLRSSEENQCRSSRCTSKQTDPFIKNCPPLRTIGDQESNGNTVTPATKEQHEQLRLQQQQFLCSVQGFLPAQVGGDFLIDITSSAGTPGALLSGHSPCHMMLDPESGHCFYVNTPPQRKMLLDPETGQYVQVFLPAAKSSPNMSVFPVRCANPAPVLINHATSTLNPAPTILSVMQFQPTIAMSSLRRLGNMAQFQVAPPEKFTFKTEDWPKWIKRFDRFRIASGLETQVDENQVNALIYTMGEEAEDILVSLHLSPEDASEYATVKEKLDAHFVARRNVIFERAKFNQRQQETGESAFDCFITALHCLAEHCEYRDLHDEMVRDRLVVGLRDKRLSEQLQMDPELTLEKAVIRVKQSEQVKKQQEMLKTNFKSDITNTQLDNVHAQQRGGTRPKQAKTQPRQTYKKAQDRQCKRCGCGDTGGHTLQQCPAREATCNHCRKKGHYARVCRTKKLHEVNVASATENVDDYEVAFLGSLITDSGSSPWLTEIKMDNHETVFKIDTGADVSAVPETLYGQGQFSRLERAKIILKGPGRTTLKVKGKFTATLRRGNRMLKEDIYVVRGLCIPLLSRPAATALQLVARLDNISLDSTEIVKQEFPKLFSGLGKMEGEYNIVLKPGAQPFSLSMSRRISLPLLPKIKEELNRMEQQGVISKVDEPTEWCAPMVVVPKSTGRGVRIFSDLTELNKSVLRERHPLPSVENTLGQLAGAKVFSKLDANAGFWHIPLSKESSLLTTFITPLGRYCYNRLCLGISSAPEHFQKRVCSRFWMVWMECCVR
ncbi:hypothetical protein L3Q82_006673 [Scortum barcoo]|uniref:Uncharacterized protein n=1 Tax=Scortum barcoo TaxID=214431 RepID=A0ACB8X059_9TELE|nr:hypothetical protein L3Q82_006673 [Scortum barcoo]